MGRQFGSETGDTKAKRIGQQVPGETGDTKAGRIGQQVPGETGDTKAGRIGQQVPGETGDTKAGRIGQQLPSETGDTKAGRTGQQLPSEIGDTKAERIDQQLSGETGGPLGSLGELDPKVELRGHLQDGIRQGQSIRDELLASAHNPTTLIAERIGTWRLSNYGRLAGAFGPTSKEAQGYLQLSNPDLVDQLNPPRPKLETFRRVLDAEIDYLDEIDRRLSLEIAYSGDVLQRLRGLTYRSRLPRPYATSIGAGRLEVRNRLKDQIGEGRTIAETIDDPTRFEYRLRNWRQSNRILLEIGFKSQDALDGYVALIEQVEVQADQGQRLPKQLEVELSYLEGLSVRTELRRDLSVPEELVESLTKLANSADADLNEKDSQVVRASFSVIIELIKRMTPDSTQLPEEASGPGLLARARDAVEIIGKIAAAYTAFQKGWDIVRPMVEEILKRIQ